MLKMEEITRHLQYMVLSRVEDETGVNRNTLMRIRNGLAVRPSHDAIMRLSSFLMGLRNDK